MRREVALLLLLCSGALLVACQQEPPTYETKVPVSAVAPTHQGLVPPAAAFTDNFDRADTTRGLGPGWEMHGPYDGSFPMPPATDGFIRDKQYTYDGESIVYASRRFPQTINTIGAIGHWTRAKPGAAETTIALVISANNKLVSDMVHLVASRSTWALTVRRASSGNGAFEPVAQGSFKPPLELERDYSFQLQAVENTVTVTVPNQPNNVTHVALDGLVGPYAFWELFFDYRQPKPGVLFDYRNVWAD